MTGRLFSANSEAWCWVSSYPWELSQQGALVPSAMQLPWKDLGTINDIKYPKLFDHRLF